MIGKVILAGAALDVTDALLALSLKQRVDRWTAELRRDKRTPSEQYRDAWLEIEMGQKPLSPLARRFSAVVSRVEAMAEEVISGQRPVAPSFSSMFQK